jgi:NAD(P)-dependent dehydrogenase (short-subunit alcohol dehydrogenase family)
MTAEDAAPVAIVTGAGRGIGRAIATTLAVDGFRLVAVDLDGESADATARLLAAQGGPEPLAFRADVRDHARAQAIVGEVLDRFGRVDALVNNAGITQPKPFVELTEADWDLTIGVHLKGSFNWSHAVARPMLARGRGRIVCISSMNAKTGGAFPAVSKTAYAAAKAGILGLVRGLARELAPHVTVNAICPGLIETELVASMTRGPQREQALAAVPAARLGQPADIANAVAFLISERAGYITGEVMDVNGGLYVD